MDSTLLISFVRLVRTKRPWQRQKLLDLSSFSAVGFSGKVYPGRVSACLCFSDALDESGRDIQQIMSLLFLLSSWNTVLLPVEFRTDH